MRLISGLTAGLTAGAITRTDGRTDLRRNTYSNLEISPYVTRARAYRRSTVLGTERRRFAPAWSVG